MFILLFILINTVYSQYTSFCYNLTSASSLNEGILIINGTGEMCDCDSQSFDYSFDILSVRMVLFDQGDSTTVIGKQCFANFINLQQVQFSTTIQKIKEYAFYNTLLSYIQIPSSVEIIEQYAFKNCKKLYQVEFAQHSEVKTLATNTFENCLDLRYFILPDSLETFNRDAFTGCKRLSAIMAHESNNNFYTENYINQLNDDSTSKITCTTNYDYINGTYSNSDMSVSIDNNSVVITKDSTEITPSTFIVDSYTDGYDIYQTSTMTYVQTVDETDVTYTLVLNFKNDKLVSSTLDGVDISLSE